MNRKKIKRILAINFLVFLAFFAAVFSILEIGTRVRQRFSENERYAHIWHLESPAYREILNAFPGAQAHRDSLFTATRAGLKYYDYFLFSVAPVKTPTVVFTDYYSSRRVPDSAPLDSADVIIWLFGGSTMQNLDAPDEQTIANFMAQEFKRNGVRAAVVNFGTLMFHSSLEFVKFTDLLRRVPEAERPAFAVFYDGYNDPYYGLYSGPGNIPLEASSGAAAVIERNHPKAEFYRLLYDSLLRHSAFWKRYVHPRIVGHEVPPSGLSISGGNFSRILEDTTSTYLKNKTMTDAVCGAFQIRCLHVLQPMLFTKSPLHGAETRELDSIDKQNPGLLIAYRRFYKGIAAKLARQDAFLDLSDAFNGRGDQQDFYDIGHTNPFGPPRIIAARLAATLLKWMK
ncbi:MAG: hypothetical protein Q8Q08_12085 [Candidatus Omnitrophota bacterium]|nr:hypothetical protein [Candidatus Omnitrophota bacterium]MDZ4242191.1 hypothetical protein [Candidatus Omnitrophota bacterium]